MILTVVLGKQPNFTDAGIAAGVLCGAGILQPFPSYSDDPQTWQVFFRPAPGPQAIQVQCPQPLGWFAKKGYEALGYQTVEQVSPAPQPPMNSPVTLTVTPMLADDKYPLRLGGERYGRAATMALYGASLLRDPYSGGADTSFQVVCDKADVRSVTSGFAFAFFQAA